MADSKTPNIDAAKAARKQNVDADKLHDELMADPTFAKIAEENRKKNEELLQNSSKAANDLSKIYESFKFIGGLFNPAKVKATFSPIFNIKANDQPQSPISTLSDASGSKTQRAELTKNVKELNENIVSLNETLKNSSPISPAQGRNRGFFDFFRSRGNPSSGNPQESPTESAEKERQRNKVLTNLMAFIGKGFSGLKVASNRVTETVSSIFQGIRDMPRKLVTVIQKTAMAIPNGIVAFTKKLMGGAGQAIGAFIEGLGKSFAVLGKFKTPILYGAAALIAMSGAIGAFGLAMMSVGKGIELIITGIATGIDRLSEAFVKISNTNIDDSKIQAFGKTINDFFKTQNFWDTLNGAMLRLVPNLEKLANSLVAVSKMELNREKLLDIGKTINDFLGSFDMKNTFGAILTNVFNPENTEKMAQALKNIDGFQLNRTNLLSTATTLGEFLTSLGNSTDIWASVKSSISSFLNGSKTFEDAAKNINFLSDIKPIPKESTDRLTYFITSITKPVQDLIAAAPGMFSGDVNYLGKIADQVNQLTKIDVAKLDPLVKAAVGVDAVAHMAKVLANLDLGGEGGWFTNSTTQRLANQINALADIKTEPFEKLDNFTRLAPGMNAMADAINRTADAIEHLAKTPQITNSIMDNLGTITAADIANRALQAQAANQLTQVVNTNNTVNNTNVTQMAPVSPTRLPSYADAALNRGR